MALGHQKSLVSRIVLEGECIEYLQLRHRGNDHLQGLECLIACAELVKKKSQHTPPTSTTWSKRTLRESGRCRQYGELHEQMR